MSQVEHILHEISLLTKEERLELQIRLIEAESVAPHEDVHAAWGAEVASRVAAYKRGELVAKPGDEVLARMDRELASRRA